MRTIPIVVSTLLMLVQLTSCFAFTKFKLLQFSALQKLQRKTLHNIKMTPKTSMLQGKLEVSISDAIAVHGAKDVKFVDGSWFLGNTRETTNRQDYERGPRITGGKFLDIDDIADKETKPNLPHMMPTAELFAAAMDALDIDITDHVIVYGQEKCPFIHRAWFQFGCMGHPWDRLHLLKGSLKEWIDSNGPIEIEKATSIYASQLDLSKPASYHAIRPRNIVSIDDVRQIVNEKITDTIILDARSPDRFYGRVDEPRPGLHRGHMPGARNAFFLNLLDTDNPVFLKPALHLLPIFLNSGINIDDIKDKNIKIITTCGSGATACSVAAALRKCQINPNSILVYDGSW